MHDAQSDTSFDEVYRELKQRQAMEEAQRRIAIREGSVEERKVRTCNRT